MGELKDLRSQQETLVSRAKEINRKVWLAGIGAVSKAAEAFTVEQAGPRTLREQAEVREIFFNPSPD